jgi:hypothetical protein
MQGQATDIPPTEQQPPSGGDSESALRWDCGHLITAHSRSDAAKCREQRLQHDNQVSPPDGYGNKSSSSTHTTAVDICATAANLVGGSRKGTHGDKTINFANTAALWNAILEAKLRQISAAELQAFPRLTALDVANMLEAFKIARRYSGTHNLDDYIDGAGYAGCAGEVADRASR